MPDETHLFWGRELRIRKDYAISEICEFDHQIKRSQKICSTG